MAISVDQNPLQIGDQVRLSFGEDAMELAHAWGLSTGQIAEVIGFGTTHYGRIDNFGHQPGIYTIFQAPILRLPDGRTQGLNVQYLDMVDQEEYQRRCHQGQLNSGQYVWQSELPGTPFWEGDIVRSSRPGLDGYEEMEVVRVDYSKLDQFCSDGVTPYPCYSISPHSSSQRWETYDSHLDLQLIRRGNVYRYFNGQPLEFADILEEASFFISLGQIDEVKNPISDLYSWTEEQARQAVKSGLADTPIIQPGFFGASPHLSLYRFHDQKLGRRVAAHVLANG